MIACSKYITRQNKVKELKKRKKKKTKRRKRKKENKKKKRNKNKSDQKESKSVQTPSISPKAYFPLHEKCPNMQLFLVCIFLYSD